MKEQGGYSGPQLFHHTANLVKRYRRILDLPLHGQNESHQTQLQPQETMGMRIEATIKRDEENLKAYPRQSIDQPLLRVPERHTSSTTDGTAADSASTISASHHHEQPSTSEVSEPAKLTPKVIFCTGGVENGQQALEVLNAGASVAQIYSKLDLSTTGAAFANA
jgi:dihydroorotate dehydrogenase